MTEKHFKLYFRVAKADEGKTVREFLRANSISRAALKDIKFNGGGISVNGADVTVRKILRAGDLLEVTFPEEKSSGGVLSENLPLDILYEDDYLLVVNKPAGMPTIPSREHPRGSLANAVAGYYGKTGLSSAVHIVTRLDRNTSGIVLIAKYRHIHHLFSQQQREGRIIRIYEAFAEGVFTKRRGRVEESIARKKDSIIEREVNPDGQYACTYFEVVRQYCSYAHVRLRPKTGRTHQIRVHLAYLGHPLLGDDLYGGSLKLIDRQALHCSGINFYHPFLGKELEITAPLPDDMKRLAKINEE